MNDTYSETLKPILQVRNSDGDIVDIVALRGKSAYEFAREGGFSGTVGNFIEAISSVTGGFTWSWDNNTIVGPTATLRFGDYNSYSIDSIPSASLTSSGIVTTINQSFLGEKSFQDTAYFEKNIKITEGSIQGAAKAGSWFQGRDLALVSMTSQDNQYRPGLAISTYRWTTAENNTTVINGGIWAFGNYLDSNLALTFTPYSAYENNINTKNVQIVFTPDGNATFSSIKTTKDTVTPEGTGKSAGARNALIIYGPTYGNAEANIKTSGVLSYGDPGPQLIFGTNTTLGSSQKIALIYTDNDTIHTGNSLTLTSTEAKTAFIVPTGTVSAKNLSIQNPSNVTGAGVTNHFHPSTNNTYYLGNSTYRWQYLYVNNINSTGSVYLSSNYDGYIKFTRANPAVSGMTNLIAKFSYGGANVDGSDDNSRYGASVNVQWTKSSDTITNYSLLFTRWDENHSALFVTYNGINETESRSYLGVAKRRWSAVYAVNGTIQTSDANLKTVIEDKEHLNKLLYVYDNITPVAYKWKNNGENDTHDRTHVGLISQNVENKMLEIGLSDLDFGGLCKDAQYNDDNDIVGYDYSLRYTEFHGLHILKNQQQDTRIKELEEKNKELENTILDLKTQIELIKLAIGG